MSKRAYSSIVNIFGFAVGLACSFLLLLWVFHEFRYDRFHDDHERIFRIGMQYQIAGSMQTAGQSMSVLGPALDEAIPELEAYVRTSSRLWSESVVCPDLERFMKELDVIYADPAFFEIFSFDLIEGDPKTALNHPYSIVITEEIARIFFPYQDPLGQTLLFNGNPRIITGIVQTPPAYTHFAFSIVASIETLFQDERKEIRESYLSWNNINSNLYVKLQEGANENMFLDKVKEIVESNVDSRFRDHIFGFFLQPVHTIYTDPVVEGGFKENVNRGRLRILFIASLLLLIVAGINYVLHSFARSSMRIKEVGVRKILGAGRSALVVQFLIESVVTTFFAFLVAILLMEYLLPLFNAVFGTSIYFFSLRNRFVILLFPVLVLIIGVMAGAYPAFYLSGMRPARVMHERFISRGRTFSLRNCLVLSQIIIAIGLMMCASVMRGQFYLIQSRQLGFTTDNRIIIPLDHSYLRRSYAMFKERLNNTPGVVLAAGSDKAPGANFSANPVLIPGFNDPPLVHRHEVDAMYLELMDIRVLEGRGFDPGLMTDTDNVLVNECFINQFGLENPLEQRIGRPVAPDEYKFFRIIGVVEDYHYASLHSPIQPLVIYLKNYPGSFVSAYLEQEGQAQILDRIESLWKSTFPVDPFKFYYLDEAYDRFYHSERNMQRILDLSTLLIILISMLGLYGLVHLDTLNRTKEIGIRKVFGASARHIAKQFIEHYALFTGVAAIVALPVVYILMLRWLHTFAYTVNLNNPLLFIVPVLLMLLLTLATSISQIIRVARNNPIESLRYE